MGRSTEEHDMEKEGPCLGPGRGGRWCSSMSISSSILLCRRLQLRPAPLLICEACCSSPRTSATSAPTTSLTTPSCRASRRASKRPGEPASSAAVDHARMRGAAGRVQPAEMRKRSRRRGAGSPTARTHLVSFSSLTPSAHGKRARPAGGPETEEDVEPWRATTDSVHRKSPPIQSS